MNSSSAAPPLKNPDNRPSGASARKTQPPRIRIAASPRQILIDKLDASLDVAVTVIQSPAGFGKTVLLSQWYEQLAARPNVIVGWLSLDEEDGEASHFLSNAASALDAAGLAIGDAFATPTHSLVEVGQRLGVLVDAIESSPASVVLMLDDYHRADCAELSGLIDHLLKGAPSHFQLVVSTRELPRIRLAAFEANGLVARIGPDDLALDLREASGIFENQMSEATIAALHARTEGWAVALQLAKLWLANDGHREDQIAAFTGRTETLARYLLEQVMCDLEPWIQDFLRETAILEAFDAETANAVRGFDNARLALARLAPFEALLVPLDPDRRWFRYHHLFAEFLHEQLMRHAPERATELHQQASLVFASAGDLQLAVKHSCLAGDQQRAVSLIERAGGWQLVRFSGIGLGRNLLMQFSEQFVETEPALLHMRGYLQLKMGDIAEAQRCIDAATKISDQGIVRRNGLLVNALFRVYTDKLLDVAWLGQLECDVAALPAEDHLAHGLLRGVLAVAAIERGDFHHAERESRTSIAEMAAAPSLLGKAYGQCFLAQSQFYLGMFTQTEADLRNLLTLFENKLVGDRAQEAIANGLLGNILYWRNELDEARGRLESAIPALEAPDTWIDVVGTVFQSGIGLARHHEDYAGASALLGQLEELSRSRAVPQLLALARAWRVETLIAAGDTAGAEAAASTIEPAYGWRAETANGIAMAQLLLQIDRSAEAVRLLRSNRALAANQGRLLDQMRFDALLATAFRLRDEPEKMILAATDALTNPLASLAPRALLGFGMNMLPTWTAVLRTSDINGLPTQAHQFALRLRNEAASVGAQGAATLTPRENSVLAELCVGRSNKEIARRLDLSENTVKYHLKRIYDKLGAQSRSGAVTAALKSGLAHIPK